MSEVIERHGQVAQNAKYMSKLMTEMKRNRNRNRIRVSENNSSDNDSYKPADTRNVKSFASL